MSIIVYAPLGQMKDLERNAERLREFFKMQEVQGPDFDPFPITAEQIEEFKNGGVFYITDVTPHSKGYSTNVYDGKRRILSYFQAMKLMKGE